MDNKINPTHYSRLNPEPKDVIRKWNLNFNLGSAVKYIARCGYKDGSNPMEDLQKAKQFIDFEIEYLKQMSQWASRFTFLDDWMRANRIHDEDE